MNFPIRTVIQIVFYPDYFFSFILEESMLWNIIIGKSNVCQKKSALVI